MSGRTHAHSARAARGAGRSTKGGAPASAPRPFRRASQGPGGKPAGSTRRRVRSVRSGTRTPTGTKSAPSTKKSAPSTKKSPPTAKQPTSALTRRSRIPVALAAIFAAAVLITSFPLSSLLAQHRALSAADAQLAAVRNEEHTLAQQQQDLNSKSAVDRLARQDYQMVLPGQTLYDVLPPSGQPASAVAGTSASGDPGTQPLVAPDHAPDLSPEPGLSPTTVPASAGAHTPTVASRSGASAGSTPATGFWSRVSSTLEFWK